MNRPTTPVDPRRPAASAGRQLRRAGDALRRWWIASVHLRMVDTRAQSTVEYALVLLGAAAVALALIAWVTRSDAVGRLFDAVIGRVLRQAG